jgi:hypothetical protein
MKRSIMSRATAPVVALLIGSAIAVSAADGQTGRTLEFAGSIPRDGKTTDVRPRGTSTGDQFLVAVNLRTDGRVAGRGHFICTVIDNRYEGQDCQIVLVLRDGTVTAAGGGLHKLLPGQPADPAPFTDEFAVTGGTGAYGGASGTLSITTHKDDSSAITLKL